VKKNPGPRDTLLAPGSVVLTPVSVACRRTWRAFALAALHLPILVLTVTVVVTGLALSVGLIPLALLGVPVFGLTVLVSRSLARMERSRAAGILGLEIEKPVWPEETTKQWWWRGALRDLKLGQTWRMLAYLGLSFPIAGTILTFTTLGPPAFGIGAILGPWIVGEGPGARSSWLWTAAGLLALALTPPMAQASEALWSALVRSHLSPSEAVELSERVESLEVSREALLKAAETERARIERDLHDGAQQRLVSLTMNLGIARSRMKRDPDSAAEHVAAAHEDAKAALGELRDLARGIHPVILSDRGLDAALSAVAARAPIPVEVDVEVTPRPSATVEAVAYFVVTEALTNVARHAQASKAWVHAERRGDVLHLEVGDDGRGGADLESGTGLAGLRNRVAGAEGTFSITSPDGGPTHLFVELPCAS
jgi:signal transduction histidine kinase